jgi:hypothetical protein
MPNEIDPLEFGGVEPTAEPARQVVGGKPCSEPRQVEQVNTTALGQRLEDRLPPAPGAGEPVYEDDRLAFAGDPILDRPPVEHELPNLHDESVWQAEGCART